MGERVGRASGASEWGERLGRATGAGLVIGASRGIGAATVRAGRRLLRVIAGAPDRATRNRLAAETGPGMDSYRALSPEEVAETVARALGIVAPILPGDP